VNLTKGKALVKKVKGWKIDFLMSKEKKKSEAGL
jgi:hypothetical protein